MDEEKAKKAKKFWTIFSKDDWPSDIKIIGDYRHAWGSDWNGFLVIEAEPFGNAVYVYVPLHTNEIYTQYK